MKMGKHFERLFPEADLKLESEYKTLIEVSLYTFSSCLLLSQHDKTTLYNCLIVSFSAFSLTLKCANDVI